jgi:tetratricopeptide (TPR) repeat protein
MLDGHSLWQRRSYLHTMLTSMLRLFIFSLFCGSLLGVFGCEAESPWDVSMREVEDAIEHGEYDQAEGVLLEALPRAEIFGEADKRLALVLHDLGEVYRRQNQLTKAEPYYWRALPIWAKSVGAEHPEMARSLTGLARLYQAKQEYQKAEPLVKQALKIRKQAFGMNDPHIVTSLDDYIVLLKLMDREEEAKTFETRRQSILKK